MKKRLILAAIFAASAAVVFAIAFRIGFNRGVTHALDDSLYMVLDFDEHDEYDFDLHIYLDGEHYINGLFVG